MPGSQPGIFMAASALLTILGLSRSRDGKSPRPSKAIVKSQTLVDQAPQASARRQGR